MARTFCSTRTCPAFRQAINRGWRFWCTAAGAQLRAQLLSLRLAVLFHHARTIIALPRVQVTDGGRIGVGVSERWLAKHPLTAHLLAKERRQWKELGHPWKNV